MDEFDKVTEEIRELGEVAKLVTKYGLRADEHKTARIDRNDDTPHYNCVLEEWLYDHEKRLKELEILLKG